MSLISVRYRSFDTLPGERSIPDHTATGASALASAPAGPDTLAAERAGKISVPPRLAALQNAILAASLVLMIAVWIAAGWAFFASFNNLPSPPKPAPALAQQSAPSVMEKSVSENPAPAAETPPSAEKPTEPTSVAAVPDTNPPKPPAPQPLAKADAAPGAQAAAPLAALQSAGSGDQRQAAESPPVVEPIEAVDPAARELISQGWAAYYHSYSLARWQEARRNFERALEIDPQSSEARIGLASILSAKLADEWSPVLQEDLPRAERLLLEAIDKGGGANREAAHYTLGVLRQMQNRLSEARKEFELAISLDPRDARAHTHLGEALLYLGEPEAAIPSLEQAIRLRPDDPNIAVTYWALGACHLLLHRVDQAIDLLQTARAANARWWVPYLYLAAAYGLKGDLDRAKAALAVSLHLKPALRSIARMRAENPWLSKPQYWALQAKTINLGLQRAGFPDQ